ncbi:MAG: alanine--tRNA ligase [Herpetosiphonaceae bacterium]|nr:MAG: alanine--tRNA ligase [Herpetosiphonaceae bacterium]
MKSAEIRKKFLDYFAKNDHTIVPSSPLVPANDPTLLFTNAGMVQFKDTFLGLEERPYKRAVSSQKCMRVSGKHNDLEEVGPSPRHHTFFEMLGNFSFGDYFKRDAIRFAWEFLTRELKLPVERLWFTVFEGDGDVPADDEAARLWEEVGADPSRILRFGRKDNFWEMGATGPCGPNSEITIYIGDDVNAQRPEGVNSDDPNYLEIWNLVFMQYERHEDGSLTPLPKPSIDTGAGLERLASVLQSVKNNYETDLFVPIIERTMALLGKDRRHYQEYRAAYHAIADHSRAIAFLIADGLRPGNEGRNYVVRRILRRAAYQGQTIGFDRPFLAETADVVIELMGDHYPELRARRDYIKDVITAEEERFYATLSKGLRHLENALERMRQQGEAVLPGRDAFTLHDTYGFPLDLTEKILAERGLSVDSAGYEEARREQQERARAATQFKRGSEAERWADRALPATDFTGYAELHTWGHILALEVDGEEVREVQIGQQVKLVLDRTPFYAESGGQVADTGLISGPRGRIRIEDVQKPLPELFVHSGVVEEGLVSVGETVEMQVDAERRRDIMRNHTATHLLHRALRDVLGEHAEQKGSLVAPDRLRFDFSHPRPVTPEQLRNIERSINDWIRADQEVEAAQMSFSAARELGAIALFGEKYGDRVRVITIGCGDGAEETLPGPTAVAAHPHPEPAVCSRELCGGTHVKRTGEIGYFRIISEGSIGSGLRRIEALTGRAAEDWVEQQTQVLRDLASRLAAQPAQLVERVEALLAELKARHNELGALRMRLAEGQIDQLLGQAQQANGVSYIAAQVEAVDMDSLRQLAERLRSRVESGVIVLGALVGERPQLVVAVTPDLVKRGYNAGSIVRELVSAIGGGGGGRPELAQAGGRDPQGLQTALGRVGEVVAASS